MKRYKAKLDKDEASTITCDKLVVVISPDEMKSSVFTNDPMVVDLFTTIENSYIESKLLNKPCPYRVEEGTQINFMKGTPLPNQDKKFPQQLIDDIEEEGKEVVIAERTGWQLRGVYDPQTWLFWIVAKKRIGVGIVSLTDNKPSLEELGAEQLNLFEKEGKE